jgi:hypothetical protein
VTIAWIGPLVSAGVAIAQALEGARATASAEEQAEIDRALATIRGTDTRVTARHDADLAVRLTRGGVAVPVAPAGSVRVRAAHAAPQPAIDVARLDAIVAVVLREAAMEGLLDPGGGLLAASPPPSPYEPDSEDGA